MTLTTIELGFLLGGIESDDERIDTLLRHAPLLAQGRPIDRHVQTVLDLPPDELRRGALARALNIILLSSIFSGDGRSRVEIGNRSVALYRELGERDGEAHALYHLASVYWGQGRLAEALEYLPRCMELWRAEGNIAGVTGVLNKMAMIHHDQGDYAVALRMLREALALGETSGNPRMVARELSSLGLVFTNFGIFDRALEYHQRSLSLREENGDEQDMISSLLNIGLLYHKISDFERGCSVVTRALEMSRQIGMRRSEAKALQNLAVHYMGLGDRAAALACYKESLAIKEELEDRVGMASSLNGIAWICCELEEYDEALRYATRSAEIREEIGLRPGIAAALHRLGNIQGLRGDFAAAVETLNRALAIVGEMGVKSDMRQIHFELAEVLKRRGDYRGAIEHCEEYIRLDREIYSEETNRRLRNMTIAYEVEQMEKEAKILRLNNERLEQEAEFRKKELTSTAIYLTQKNEFLRKLRRRVEEIGRDAMLPEVTEHLRSIMEDIDEAVASEQHWSTFEKQFHQVHAGYLEILAERYPKLTPTELKVCALIKINVSTKEIAQILNTEPRSVEKYRQRIRKKLELAQDENLGAFLTALGRQREAPVENA